MKMATFKSAALLLLLLTSCNMSTKDKCEFSNGTKAFIGAPTASCEDDNFKLCHDFCYSSGQGYVDVVQMSLGMCICNNKEGWKAADAYHYWLNHKHPIGNLEKYSAR